MSEGEAPVPFPFLEGYVTGLSLQPGRVLTESDCATLTRVAMALSMGAKHHAQARGAAGDGGLRELAEDIAEDGCTYGDNCTLAAMALRKHGECLACRARRALEAESRAEPIMTHDEREAWIRTDPSEGRENDGE